MLHSTSYFPPPESADSEGFLLFGGELTPDWILDAYRNGIFPWPVFDDVELMAWWSPDPRAIVELDGLHVSRRLARTLRSGRFEVTVNQDFSSVVRACASVGDRACATWLTPEMIDAYEGLHRDGYAQSVEVWQDGQLAGGTYGVAIGAFFSAESMFYRVRDASKVALVHLVRRLQLRGFELLDIQQLTDHTAALGAREVGRDEYLSRLSRALERNVSFVAGQECQV
jgi:leucyl/phenylalanyl-tRNA--protein transferase